MRIGEVAQRAGLSLRTVRYFEHVGLVRPSGRSPGGFRLFTEADLARLLLIRDMKPLSLSVDEMSELLNLLERLDSPETSHAEKIVAIERLDAYRMAAEVRCEALLAQVRRAESLAQSLRQRLAQQKSAQRSR